MLACGSSGSDFPFQLRVASSTFLRLAPAPITSGSGVEWRGPQKRRTGHGKRATGNLPNTRSPSSLGVEIDLGRDDVREFARRGPVGVAQEDVAVGDQRLLPVAAVRADGQELLLDDVLAVRTHELGKP